MHGGLATIVVRSFQLQVYEAREGTRIEPLPLPTYIHEEDGGSNETSESTISNETNRSESRTSQRQTLSFKAPNMVTTLGQGERKRMNELCFVNGMLWASLFRPSLLIFFSYFFFTYLYCFFNSNIVVMIY